MQTAYFTDHLGFISDYIAEIFHEGMRNRNFADIHEQYFSFGNHLEARDRTAVVKTVSGLVKLLHPANDPTRQEVEEYVSFALEMRRRVKEQLKRMGGIEYAKVNFSCIDKETGEEHFVGCPELGSIQLIPDTPLPPGDIFTIGYDQTEGRYSLYRVQITICVGSGKFNLVGTSSKNIRESARMATVKPRFTITERELNYFRQLIFPVARIDLPKRLQKRKCGNKRAMLHFSLRLSGWVMIRG